MKWSIRKSLCIIVLLYVWIPFAHAIDPMVFQNATEEARFRQLVAELRCTVCQNQNLADSDAALAEDLRQRVLEMLQQGYTDDAIKQFLVDRYGDFVLYQPPLKITTYALWFGPLVVLLLGAWGVWRVIKQHRTSLP